ncbi:MAG TPA: ester cyclase [Ktedonobacteraceae bacterium]|nr:ester cyclase [Ktedonobacteraceae bacterium]
MTTDTATLESNKKVVERFFQAFNDRRPEDLPLYMAADVIDHNKIIVGEEDVPGAAFEGFRQQLVAFNPGRMDVEELVAEDNRVVARITISGVHSGYHPRMPEPTNRSVVAEAIFLFTLKDGKIREIRAVNDRLGMFIQLGWDWPTFE